MGQDFQWRKIERFLKEGTLVPLLGPGVITYGEDDRLLRPWLIEQLEAHLDLASGHADLNSLVCDYLRNKGTCEDASVVLADLLDTADLHPGTLLRQLASISQCQQFFTLAFDPLLERALREVRGSLSTWSLSNASSPLEKQPDLPAPGAVGTTLGYLFGKISSSGHFHLWDADAVEFIFKLQEVLPTLNRLATCLADNNLLIIGAQMSDWTVRFLLRAIRQAPLTGDAGRQLLLADLSPATHTDAVIYYESLTRSIQVIPGDSVDFARELCRRAFAVQPPLVPGARVEGNPAFPLKKTDEQKGLIFISYSHLDKEATFRLAKLLQARGCSLWLDQERIQWGDDFENRLETAVRKSCAFFLSVVSRRTEGLLDISYLYKERFWAADQAKMRRRGSHGYYFAAVIDDVPMPLEHTDNVFKNGHVVLAPGGELATEDIDAIYRAQQEFYTSPKAV